MFWPIFFIIYLIFATLSAFAWIHIWQDGQDENSNHYEVGIGSILILLLCIVGSIIGLIVAFIYADDVGIDMPTFKVKKKKK